MARNIEIKARIDHVDSLWQAAASISDSEPTEIFQDDTFFHCPQGRLKLRVFADGAGQLIFYQRPDTTGPKESYYILSPTASPDTLRRVLACAFGEIGRVCKHRTLLSHLGRVKTPTFRWQL